MGAWEKMVGADPASPYAQFSRNLRNLGAAGANEVWRGPLNAITGAHPNELAQVFDRQIKENPNAPGVGAARTLFNAGNTLGSVAAPAALAGTAAGATSLGRFVPAAMKSPILAATPGAATNVVRGAVRGVGMGVGALRGAAGAARGAVGLGGRAAAGAGAVGAAADGAAGAGAVGAAEATGAAGSVGSMGVRGLAGRAAAWARQGVGNKALIAGGLIAPPFTFPLAQKGIEAAGRLSEGPQEWMNNDIHDFATNFSRQDDFQLAEQARRSGDPKPMQAWLEKTLPNRVDVMAQRAGMSTDEYKAKFAQMSPAERYNESLNRNPDLQRAVTRLHSEGDPNPVATVFNSFRNLDPLYQVGLGIGLPLGLLMIAQHVGAVPMLLSLLGAGGLTYGMMSGGSGGGQGGNDAASSVPEETGAEPESDQLGTAIDAYLGDEQSLGDMAKHYYASGGGNGFGRLAYQMNVNPRMIASWGKWYDPNGTNEMLVNGIDEGLQKRLPGSSPETRAKLISEMIADRKAQLETYRQATQQSGMSPVQ